MSLKISFRWVNLFTIAYNYSSEYPFICLSNITLQFPAFDIF